MADAGKRSWVHRGLAMLLGFTLLIPPALTHASTPAHVSVELNKLEPHDGACRAYLVIENKTESRFDALKLDLVMFATDGVVNKRLAVEIAPLPAGKTSLKVFDMDELACEEVGRVLLNDVLVCDDGTGARTDCVDLIAQSSRTTVAFIK